MYIEILTWEEIQQLSEFHDESLDTGSTYWDQEKETDFAIQYPNRIVKLLHDVPDADGDYECENFFYPPCVIKQGISDNIFGEHRIVKRNPYVIAI